MATLNPPISPARKRLILGSAHDGRRAIVQAAFAPEVAAAMKAAGLTWFGPRRGWLGSIERVTGLQGALRGVAAQLTHLDGTGAQALLNEGLKAPAQADLVVPLMDAQLMPVDGGGAAFSSLHDPVTATALRTIGATFHRYARAWQVDAPVEVVLQTLAEHAALPAQHVFVHATTITLETLTTASSRALPIAVPGAPPPANGVPANRVTGTAFLSVIGEELQALPVHASVLRSAAADFGLRDYQVDGVRHLLSQSSALLADDMGLGKTRQAVVAAHLAATTDEKILVVCPASLRINWAREIAAVRPTDAIALVGDAPAEALMGMRWIIANYERLGVLVRAERMKIAVMIIDEAHYLKEHESGRTRNAFLLSQRVRRRFLLTGTPVLNREIEIHTLMRLGGHPLGHLTLADFREHYAGDGAKRANLAHQLSSWMLRRTKGVLTDLGTKREVVCYVDPGDAIERYRAILVDPALTVMPKIVKLRKALERLKCDFLIERLQGLSAADKAIVFCEYTDTVDLLLNALKIERIQAVSLVGSDSPQRRQRAIDTFQADSAVRVFVGTTMAAGVGITLTAANWVMFASLPWTPALKRQAEDRAYRSGQKRDVTVLVPVIPGTIDEQIYALLGAKHDIEREIVQTVRASTSMHHSPHIC